MNFESVFSFLLTLSSRRPILAEIRIRLCIRLSIHPLVLIYEALIEVPTRLELAPRGQSSSS